MNKLLSLILLVALLNVCYPLFAAEKNIELIVSSNINRLLPGEIMEVSLSLSNLSDESITVYKGYFMSSIYCDGDILQAGINEGNNLTLINYNLRPKRDDYLVIEPNQTVNILMERYLLEKDEQSDLILVSGEVYYPISKKELAIVSCYIPSEDINNMGIGYGYSNLVSENIFSNVVKVYLDKD